MKLPQLTKKIAKNIIFGNILFCLSILAQEQTEQIRIKIFPVKVSSNVTNEDVLQVVQAVGNSFCDITSEWTCLDRQFGLDALLEEVKLAQLGVTASDKAIELGQGKGANLVLVVSVGRLSSGSYTLDTQLIQLSNSEKILGDNEISPRIDDLYRYAKEKLGNSIIKKIKDKFGDKQSDSSSKVVSPNSSYKSDHSGWASWFIPGLGLGLKNRPGWGLFFFGATYITYGYYADKLQEYKNKKQEYESVIPVPFPYNFGLAGNYLYYDTRYSAYKDATNEVSNAVNLFAAVYIAQVFFSYTMNADPSFSSRTESENKKSLTYNFNIKRDISFGVPNFYGTLYNFSLTWRFQ
jgi:hypothetical protein